MLIVMWYPCKHVSYYLVEHGNLIKILYTMVETINILFDVGRNPRGRSFTFGADPYEEHEEHEEGNERKTREITQPTRTKSHMC